MCVNVVDSYSQTAKYPTWINPCPRQPVGQKNTRANIGDVLSQFERMKNEKRWRETIQFFERFYWNNFNSGDTVIVRLIRAAFERWMDAVF